MDKLNEKLLACASLHEKIAILDRLPSVQKALESPLRTFVATLTPECEYVLKQLIAMDQWEILHGGKPLQAELLRELLEKLLAIDTFYREMGGLIGYHAKVLQLLKKTIPLKKEEGFFHAPSFIDITQETEEVWNAVFSGIYELSQMAEIYPLGGAADRLHLVDEKTGMELPAAKLAFAGRTLFEGLIRDLQAREYLHFKLFHRQVITPIAIMTSQEKDNHRHVLQICESHQWFTRPKELFCFFTQPLVPALDEEGNWCVAGTLKPLFKPGGHGAIWKLARDKGVFSWLEQLGRKKALIRQINNPAAGLDYGLLAFAGHGLQKEMLFGFASCPRLIGSAEGVNVLIEKNREIFLSNIEYCDFAKFGIEDLPLRENDPHSRFSSNTNILFIDLGAISLAVEKYPYPGLLVNLKKMTFHTESGEEREQAIARLETTMQNIADVFVEEKKERLETKRTFVTYNHRHKTIATAKKAYLSGRPLHETPENCFYELLKAARELLEEHCAFQLPDKRTLKEHLEKGPEFVFLYHPALGPLYSLIREKVRGGKLAMGSNLQLEIADLELEDFDLDGSFVVRAQQVMGHLDEKRILHYSSQTGRCVLRNVSVRNRGVDWKRSKPFWKNQFHCDETVEILLEGCSEFLAENVVFEGSHRIVVRNGMRIRAEQKGKRVIFREEKMDEVRPFWQYYWEKGPKAARELAACKSVR